eukprot:1592332-Prymnesium_polylepis.1
MPPAPSAPRFGAGMASPITCGTRSRARLKPAIDVGEVMCSAFLCSSVVTARSSGLVTVESSAADDESS